MATVDNASTASVPGANGAVWAALLAASIGGFAMGFVVLLNEAGVFAAPSLYVPSGGVSGRTTIAAVVWLVSWGVLHTTWKSRQVDPRRIRLAMIILIGLGLLGCFPPLWRLL
jgi:hypothetical protein